MVRKQEERYKPPRCLGRSCFQGLSDNSQAAALLDQFPASCTCSEQGKGTSRSLRHGTSPVEIMVDKAGFSTSSLVNRVSCHHAQKNTAKNDLVSAHSPNYSQPQVSRLKHYRESHPSKHSPTIATDLGGGPGTTINHFPMSCTYHDCNGGADVESPSTTKYWATLSTKG